MKDSGISECVQNFINIKSNKGLVDYIDSKKLGEVDSTEWRSEWADRWVVYADLLAFSTRADRSPDVVLNNIIRFDRASNIAFSAYPSVRKYRFSDATFGIASSFHNALGFAISLHHCCHAMNIEYLRENLKKLFKHTITPRITLAYGNVLQLPLDNSSESRFDGLSTDVVLAGKGIVDAYKLEKLSAASLLTFGEDGLIELRDLIFKGNNSSIKSSMKIWQNCISNGHMDSQLFVRKNLVDFPWLLMRPFQFNKQELWCENRSDSEESLRFFFDVWEYSSREFFSPQSADASLEVIKHYGAASRHAIHCAQFVAGQRSHKYYTLESARKLIKADRTRNTNG